MIINETDLKQIYQESIAHRGGELGEHCPSPDELLSFFDPKIRRKKKFGIIDHVSHCSRCLREFGFLADLQRHEIELFSGMLPVIEPKPNRRFAGLLSPVRSTSSLSAAFLGIILLLASLFIILTNQEAMNGLRGTRTVLTGIMPNGIQLDVELLIFEWDRARQADSYVVEIFDESLLRLWASPRTSSNRLQVPRAGPPSLYLNRTYYWLVTGYSGDIAVAESALTEFRRTGPQKRT